MQSIPLRKVRSAFHDRYLLEDDKDHLSDADEHCRSEFGDLSRVNLDSLPRTIRECLEELNSVGGRDHFDVSHDSTYCQPKNGRELLKVIQEARQHQEQKIYACVPDSDSASSRSPKKCKLIKKISRRSSKKAVDQMAYLDKASTEIFQLPCSLKDPSEVPQIREILEIEETQPSSVQSLWQEECNNTDYLGIEKLMY